MKRVIRPCVAHCLPSTCSRTKCITYEEVAYDAIRRDDTELIDHLREKYPDILPRTHNYLVFEMEDYTGAEMVRGAMEEGQ